MTDGPLDGVRVIDLTDDSGRFATKLLAESGASVVRIGQGSHGPAMSAEDAATWPCVIDCWRRASLSIRPSRTAICSARCRAAIVAAVDRCALLPLGIAAP